MQSWGQTATHSEGDSAPPARAPTAIRSWDETGERAPWPLARSWLWGARAWAGGLSGVGATPPRAGVVPRCPPLAFAAAPRPGETTIATGALLAGRAAADVPPCHACVTADNEGADTRTPSRPPPGPTPTPLGHHLTGELDTICRAGLVLYQGRPAA